MLVSRLRPGCSNGFEPRPRSQAADERFDEQPISGVIDESIREETDNRAHAAAPRTTDRFLEKCTEQAAHAGLREEGELAGQADRSQYAWM
jgi:hypothetical protein